MGTYRSLVKEVCGIRVAQVMEDQCSESRKTQNEVRY